jgi:hypothetical protein
MPAVTLAAADSIQAGHFIPDKIKEMIRSALQAGLLIVKYEFII